MTFLVGPYQIGPYSDGPYWIALPGIGVTRDNVVESFQTIWRQPAPREVLRVLGLSRGK